MTPHELGRTASCWLNSLGGHAHPLLMVYLIMAVCTGLIHIVIRFLVISNGNQLPFFFFLSLYKEKNRKSSSQKQTMEEKWM